MTDNEKGKQPTRNGPSRQQWSVVVWMYIILGSMALLSGQWPVALLCAAIAAGAIWIRSAA